MAVSGRGGARLSRKRTSPELDFTSATSLVAAARHAERVGLPFNRFTTVHWQALGVVDGLAATGRLLKLASDHARRHGFRLAWAWVRETGAGKGEHVHILMYLPPDLATAVRKLWRRWFTRCGATWTLGGVKSVAIGGHLRQPWRNPAHWRENRDTALRYVLKGAPPDVLARLDLGGRHIPHQPGGALTGKRWGVSANIGPGARRAEGGCRGRGGGKGQQDEDQGDDHIHCRLRGRLIAPMAW